MRSIMRTRHNGSAQRLTLRAVLLVLIVSAIVLSTMTSIAFSMQRLPRGAENTIYGEVVAVSNSKNLTVLTVLPDNIDTFLNDQMNLFVNPYSFGSENIGTVPNSQMNIFLNPYATVKICNVNEPAKDIMVIHEATITYHEMEGLTVADSVKEQC
jgi:hypothetical protein